MGKEGRSFFERLTGTVNVDDFEHDSEMVGKEEKSVHEMRQINNEKVPPDTNTNQEEASDWLEDEEGEGQLTVDVFNTPNEIVIKAIVAGVKPDGLDISISRDMVTIRGKREEVREVEEEDYYYKELYWGSFSRTVLLPQEIEVEEATANEKHGLLTIRLPKVDKEKQTKLKVKSG